MSRFRFELAGANDDADLRGVLAATPTGGSLSIRFEREPSWFGAAVVDGRFRQVIACRDLDSGRVVGFGCRSVREVYANGQPTTVGYLSNLRLLQAYRQRGLVARGYERFRELHQDGCARLYLTTIAMGNRTALDVLVGKRAGLPGYHFAGRFVTVAIPFQRRCWRGSVPAGVRIGPGREQDLPAVIELLEKIGPRRQFFPRYQPQDFGPVSGLLRGLWPEDLLLAWSSGRLVGMLGAWDQGGFRQSVVQGYGGWLGRLRPIVSGLSRLRGERGLPAPGACLRCLMGAVPLVVDDDPEIFSALVDSLRARHGSGPWSHLLLGLHETDPLMLAVRGRRRVCYFTYLYVVCWADGDSDRAALDARPPYLELGSL